VTPELVAQLLAGVKLHDEPAPLAALVCEQRGDFQLDIVLEQGKYHQVKRMLAAAGNHCSALHRSAIGTLQLESLGLKEGEWCYLSPEQLALLAPV
jgi:16S rRNA pseudouridine516 synthase